MLYSRLMLRLLALRQRIRRRLVAYGLCAVGSGGVAAFLTVLTLDWLLWLPAWLRLVGGVLFLAGFVWAVLHWVIKPLRTPLGLEEVAARLERHFHKLGDRLVSTVNFVEHGRTGAPASQRMIDEVVRNTEKMTQDLPFDETLSLRPLARRAGFLAACVICLAAIFAAAPAWPTTGLYRYLYPWADIEWPRRVAIVPLSGDMTVAVGESVTVRMQVVRGLSPSLRPLVRLRELTPGGRRELIALAMRPETSLGRVPDSRQTPGSVGRVLSTEPDASVPARRTEPPEQAGFYAVIDAVTQNMAYWFEAGDASTDGSPFTIHVVRRPEVIAALAVVEPPPYAPDIPTRVHDLARGPVAAPIGGSVEITLTVSKPMRVEGPKSKVEGPMPARQVVHRSGVGLRTESGDWIPLVVSQANSSELRARFPITGDLRLRPELIDADGFENRQAPEYEIRAVPDAPPQVTVLYPASVTERTSDGWVPLVIQVEDNFGVTALELHAHRQGDPELATATWPLIDFLKSDRSDFPERRDALADSSGAGGSERTGRSAYLGLARYSWRLDSVALTTAIGSLSPGDVLVGRVKAVDNFVGAAARHASGETIGQVGFSAPIRVLIISEREFHIRLRSELARLAEQIRQAALDQAALRDRTLATVDETPGRGERAADHPQNPGRESGGPPNETSGPHSTPYSDLGSLAAQQSRMGRRLRELSEGFDALAGRIEYNLNVESPARGRLMPMYTRAGAALQELSVGPVVQAATALVEAQALHADRSGLRAAVDRAAEWQESIRRDLDSLLRMLAQWNSFRELLVKTRDLLDRQNELRRQSAEIGKSLLGKAVDTLTEAETAQLKRAQRGQEQLATDLEQLVSGMAQQAESLRDEDPAGADAIGAALSAARAHEALRHAREAAASLGANRTVTAAIAQRNAADAIRRMASALRERDARVLEELRKNLTSAIDLLRDLIGQQQTLRAASHEAGLLGLASDVAVMLSEEQRRIARNTGVLGDELSGVGRSRPTGGLGLGLSVGAFEIAPALKWLREAAAGMHRAESVLREQQAEPAVAAQDTALALLQDALALLQELADRADQQALLRSLAQIQEDLEEIITAQREVNTGIGELFDLIQARGEIGRQEARTASKLAHEQADVRRKVETHAPDLQKVVVYEWALRRVTEWMADSRHRLSQRRIDDELIALTNRIVRQLEQLIEAIVQTRELPIDASFVESAEGSAGDGESMAQSPIPTVAELLVLKAMQAKVNQRTERLYEAGALQDPSEQQLRELRTLGEDQREVRQLTEMVTKRAGQP